MSFLWHGLTEQGAQVPVQVDAQGRVIAVDGTPGVSNWDRTNGVLSPAVSTDSVEVGSGNITLNTSGSATFASTVNVGSSSSRTGTNWGFQIYGNGNTDGYAFYQDKLHTTPAAPYVLRCNVAGVGDTVDIRTDGSSVFTGNITAPNVTFRSADPQFYVKKSKNKDALPEYVGPELDLLAEIARLEALVRHLYETLRITPPAGWPVWDGNDDVLRQLRK